MDNVKSKRRFRRRRAAHGQDFELNIASIVDCLTVLITFVLATTSLLSVGVLEAQVAAAGAIQTQHENDPEKIGIELSKDQTITINLSGRVNKVHHITANRSGQWNYESLADHLAFIKGEFPSMKTATLTAGNTVPYREVIKTMEITRKALPGVLLGGF